MISRVKKSSKKVIKTKKSLQKAGFNTGITETPIIPIMVGEEDKAKKFAQKLGEKAVMATPIVFPMVPKGTARLRLQPSAAHSKENLDKGLDAIVEVGKELGLI